MADEKAPDPAARLTANRFRPGQSGNPGGRPKSLRAFRVKCRKLTPKILKEIEKRMGEADVPLSDVVKAFEAVADRGGFLKTDVQAAIETGHARLVVAAMALQTLSKEQRHALLQALAAEMTTEEPDAG